MSYEWIAEHVQQKAGVNRLYKEEWEAELLRIDDKMFAMIGGDKQKRPILSLKAEPAAGEILRAQWPDKIVPGYYMNKQHWNSVYLESDVPRTLILEMLEASYALIFSSLSKRRQQELLSENAAKTK